MAWQLEQCKILAVIKCNDDNYVVEKDLVNPKTHMIPTTQEWTKIANKL